MFLLQKLDQAARDESGAVTVDWVMLTAASIGVVVALTTTIDGGLQTVAEELNSAIRLEIVRVNSQGE